MDRVIPFPYCQFNGQILFDSNIFFEVGIIGEIGNAKAPLTKDFLDFIPEDFMAWLERITVDFAAHAHSVNTIDMEL